MKYDFNVCMLDENEKVINGEDEQPFTIRRAVRRALLGDAKEELKVKRYDLFIALKGATMDTDFSTEEVKLMRDAAIAAYPTIVAGQIAHFLDQK